MRVTFKLELKEPVTASPSIEATGSIEVGRGTIAWNIDSDNKLRAILISFSGMRLKINKEGVIETRYPELHEEVHRLGLYAANRLFLQTLVDALPFQDMFDGTPSIDAETPEEESVLSTRRRIVEKAFKLNWNHVNDFNPSVYGDLFPNSEELANYCDGLRAQSSFLKFQQFFKVVEYFIPEEGQKFDKAVSLYAASLDPQFTEDEIRSLRHLRIRCIHPRPRSLQHVSSERLSGLADVEEKMETIMKLALLFLHNSP